MKRFIRFRPAYLLTPLLSVWLLAGCTVKQFTAPAHPVHEQHEINASIDKDPGIVRFYTPYKEKVDQEMNRIIGRSAVKITRFGRSGETLMGNFFADALLQEGRKHDPETDFSFGTKGGLRRDLPQGDITVGHIYELIPFENQLVILELTGRQVQRLAQFIASSQGQPIAGMKLQIRENQATDVFIGKKPIDPKGRYKLVTYDYLANGGDHVAGLNNPLRRNDLPKKVRDIVIDYINIKTTNNQPLTPKLDGRIRLN